MKKIIIIASSILFVIILVLFIVAKIKKPSTKNGQQGLISPTTVPLPNKTLTEQEKSSVNAALPLTPYEDENFKFDFSPNINQLIVTEKTPQAREKFNEWANINGLPELVNNSQLIKFIDQSSVNSERAGDLPTPTPEFNPMIDFLNIFLNFGRGGSLDSSSQPQTNSNNNLNNINPQSSALTYFAQCDSEYANIPLPSGCNICQAGCGPTTVAMISASYLGQNYNPKTIVDKYQSSGYELSCSGSSYADAKSILENYGLKTTDYLVFNYESAKNIASDMKKFTDAGWTFFALANFTETGGSHYFWITDIDGNGNIWAYDPFYGRFQAPPYNENDRNPFPKYRLAFGVKK